MIRSVLIFFIIAAAVRPDSTYLGCFKDRPSTNNLYAAQHATVEQCINECKLKYYRYSMVRIEGFCICSNYLGEEVNSTTKCIDFCESCDFKSNLSDIYATGNLVSGPPRHVLLTNITDTSVYVRWEQPQSFTQISSYQITALVLHTYSTYSPRSPEYAYSNDTYRTTLITLLPATQYNITLRAISPDGPGALVWQTIQTKVGEPDKPEPPKIINNSGDKIEIKLTQTANNNGPISSYIVVVINEDIRQLFQEEHLKSHQEAQRDGITYYIAAEIEPKKISEKFVIGDGQYYGKYYNAPLDSNFRYKILVGIVSKLNGETRRAFSSVGRSSKVILTSHEGEVSGDSPAVIIALSIAIALLSCLLIAGIIGFIILKSRVTNRRQRLSENQELTLQGPMIEVENNGYIPEEEHSKVNHFKNLKQKLRTIPYNQIKIEPTNLLGVGKFGRVNSGSVYENNTLIPVAAYSIQDRKLTPEDKKIMLKDLDVLIRSGKHENIISLVGTCETSQILIVVLEYISLNLKDLLLGSRDSLPGRFSNMSEVQALDIAINICRGLEHLQQNNIVHKQLCARNILVGNGFVPKISGYGLAEFYSHNNLPDYTRWTALEVFRGQSHTSKSNVWSFGCLLWEICVLGGTPYGNFSNNEVSEKVIKGLRLPQMQYFSDDLYQNMLSCWQIDPDERPNFALLIESLDILKNENTLIPFLNFNLYSNFQYEQFYPDMEIAVRAVF